MFQDATYYLIRIEKSLPLKYEVHFIATYFLNTCLRVRSRSVAPFNSLKCVVVIVVVVVTFLQAVEEYKISEHKEFKFKEEPSANLKITVPEDERHCIIGMDPVPAKVSSSY